jgi:hypothetical protein
MPVGTSGCTYVFTFRGGNPPLVDRWVDCPPIGLGVKRARDGQPAQLPLTTGENCDSGTVVLLLTSAASAPWRHSHAGAGTLHTKPFPRLLSLEGAHHHRYGKCNTGPGCVCVFVVVVREGSGQCACRDCRARW